MATNIMGKVKRPLPGAAEASVTLTANIEKGSDVIVQTFTMIVEPWTHEEVLNVNFNSLTEAKILGANADLSAVTENLVLPTVGDHGATIAWSSPNAGVVSTAGVVSRPTYTQGNITLTLTATITSGTDTVTKTFNVVVMKQAQTTAEYLESYWNGTFQTSMLNGNPNKDAITTNLNFATESGVSLVVTSSNVARITGSGVVTRPATVDGNAAVTLTFAFTKDSTTVTKTLNCVVLAA